MDKFLTELLKRLGIWLFIAAVSAVIVLWVIAHREAGPGTEVQLLWGMVKYTKRSVAEPDSHWKADFAELRTRRLPRAFHLKGLCAVTHELDNVVTEAGEHLDLPMVRHLALSAARRARELAQSGDELQEIAGALEGVFSKPSTPEEIRAIVHQAHSRVDRMLEQLLSSWDLLELLYPGRGQGVARAPGPGGVVPESASMGGAMK